MRLAPSTVILALLLTAPAAPLAAPAAAENWPHWRGPHLDSTSGETGLPTTWSSGEQGEKNVRWRHDLPGPGLGISRGREKSGFAVAYRIHQPFGLGGDQGNPGGRGLEGDEAEALHVSRVVTW